MEHWAKMVHLNLDIKVNSRYRLVPIISKTTFNRDTMAQYSSIPESSHNFFKLSFSIRLLGLKFQFDIAERDFTCQFQKFMDIICSSAWVTWIDWVIVCTELILHLLAAKKIPIKNYIMSKIIWPRREILHF